MCAEREKVMKKRMYIIVIVAIIITGIIQACSVPTPGPGEDGQGLHHVGYGIYRVTDDEAGVVCWVYDNVNRTGKGISCLPINYTLLE